MSISPVDHTPARARRVRVSDESLSVELTDGREIAVPLDWFPRLRHASAAERANWRLIGAGDGIHWPDLDEDIEVEGLLAGARSAESAGSLNAWVRSRTK